MTRQLEVTRGPIRDEGTLVVFVGIDNKTGEEVEFAVQHGIGQDLYDLLRDPGEMPPVYFVESWQVLRIRKETANA